MMVDNGEKILYSTKRHWVWYLIPIWIVLISIASSTENSPPDFTTGAYDDNFSKFFILALIIIGSIIFSIKIYCAKFIVTNKRVIAKFGFIGKKSVELFFDKIESIKVERGFLGRILGYGHIVITGIGGTKFTYYWISHPLEFENVVRNIIHKE